MASSEEPPRRDSDVYLDARPQLWRNRRSSARSSQRRASLVIEPTEPDKRLHWWRFTLRDWDDDEEQDWWFASTAIPLLAATLGPLANVFSIAALVTYWRQCDVAGVDNEYDATICDWNGDKNTFVTHLEGVTFADPKWCLVLNVVSLVMGFVGNIFLLCNFTKRIRYIIALPVTIVMWYVATGILIGITVAMEMYVPPMRPQQTYTQGFWYAVLAACLYTVCSMLLMVNMLGYFLGHYPQNFTLTEAHRTLILQTMFFFIWLAGGAGVMSVIEKHYGDSKYNWSYTNALYFCDVSILTIGFGDMVPTCNIGRGIMFPYAIGGIIMLGLMVSSITKFAGELGAENIVHKHIERSRARTMERTVRSSMELQTRQGIIVEAPRNAVDAPPMPTFERETTIRIADDEANSPSDRPSAKSDQPILKLTRRATSLVIKPRAPKLLLLREEKDRFEAMRRIQADNVKFKNWSALGFSAIAFALLWGVGAAVFWQCEQASQDMTYFEALYFCYVSLLTIGYGDLAPQSNPGRPFFVVWSLIAVPVMSILVSHLGETVISKFKESSSRLADFTLLPKEGVYRHFLERHPWLLVWLQTRKERKAAAHRIEEGFPVGDDPSTASPEPKTLDQLATEVPSHHELALRLSKAIRATAADAKNDPKKRYSYEEWVVFTQLIRFTAKNGEDVEIEAAEGMIEWDWIGEDSPMLTKGSEADFVLDRLTESMGRYIRRISAAAEMDKKDRAESPVFRRGQWDEKVKEGGVVVGDPEDTAGTEVEVVRRQGTWIDPQEE
ncbi:hypothetical protein B0A48_07823 [Cryoendolithus antarcticus]|uniref:Potassium channel domain-containing protein n=1 Tax=Cryoendolithus antarcticus TaxID=1507870 RepID=A0A1V8T767_9PEZI|nr:hypothetical protein B0A48_07823 [Cryoendolithus antarcticus]